MPSYTYNGPNKSITLRGVEFPQGEAVLVDDADLEKKLDNLPFFDGDKPKEVVKPVAVSDSEKDVEIAQLKRTIGRLEHENTVLRRRVAEYEAPIDEPTPVEITPEEEVISEYTPGEPEPAAEDDPDLEIPRRGGPTGPADVEIPDDWRDMHWKRQQVLARKLTDMEITNQEDAVTAIEMELERRGDQ
ncbi:MAG: hypothetical protein HRT82_15820 [Henriciella sp.]|nr:hypothetical protein [Henriciella sp.]